jgi:hypothetical protein
MTARLHKRNVRNASCVFIGAITLGHEQSREIRLSCMAMNRSQVLACQLSHWSSALMELASEQAIVTGQGTPYHR